MAGGGSRTATEWDFDRGRPGLLPAVTRPCAPSSCHGSSPGGLSLLPSRAQWPLATQTQTTYVKKGMGCTSFRSGSFSCMVSACRLLRSPRASSMMACDSAALTDTSWMDMSLRVRETERSDRVTLEPRWKSYTEGCS